MLFQKPCPRLFGKDSGGRHGSILLRKGRDRPLEPGGDHFFREIQDLRPFGGEILPRFEFSDHESVASRKTSRSTAASSDDASIVRQQ